MIASWQEPRRDLLYLGIPALTMDTIEELREMSDEQLELTLKEAHENLFRLRIQSQTEKLDAQSELRSNRRQVARVKTIQTERTKQEQVST